MSLKQVSRAATWAESHALIEKAITMTRFPYGVTREGDAAAISPDGSKIATMVWRGDLDRNVNIYSLLIIDVDQVMNGRGTDPVATISIPFTGDSDEYFATPFSQVRFSADGRSVAFLGMFDGGPRQVYSVDVATSERRRLTDAPEGVSSFCLRPDGSLAVYGIVIPEGRDDRPEMIERDGALVMDAGLFPERPAFKSSYLVLWPEHGRQSVQFLLASDDGAPKLVSDARLNVPGSPEEGWAETQRPVPATLHLASEQVLRVYGSLVSDPTGRHALIWPYVPADGSPDLDRYEYYRSQNGFRRGLAAPYGLIDLATGTIETLLDAPHPMFADTSRSPVWSPSGESVLIFTLDPVGDPVSDTVDEQSPRWVEVEIATRQTKPLDLPRSWSVESWTAGDDGPLMRNGREIARLRPRSDGSWGNSDPLGTTARFQRFFPDPVTNGKIVVGRLEAPEEPPELGILDLSTQSLVVATNLNCDLRDQPLAEVEDIEWKGSLESWSGYLVKPMGWEPGVRYPLAILFDDGQLRETSPFLLDGGGIHLSGHPIQALASRGIVVLYTRTSDRLHELIHSPEEGKYLLDHVESAIDHLDQMEMIDVERVGLSGWSWAAYRTDYTVMHSSYRFAAATHIDIDPVDHRKGRRPFLDDDLKRIRTPMLFEAHGKTTYLSTAETADRLNMLGGAAEILYFPNAPHSVIAPRHRLRSLNVHLDWFCFWLNDDVDPDPAKKSQYARWTQLREMLAARSQSG